MEWSHVFVHSIWLMFFIHATVGATAITNVTVIDGQTPNEGRVEYIRVDDSTWQSACGDGLVYDEATVICRQLGYPGVNDYLAQWPFGMPTSIAQQRLSCHGDEENLADCSLLSVSSCSNAGGVICYEFGYLGCYLSSETLRRDLQSPCQYGLDDNENLTISNCIRLCHGINNTYTYAGLYHGDTCLCGNASTVVNQFSRVEDSHCSSSCAGRNIERCGGNSHIALFNISSYLRSTAIQLSSVSCRAAPPSTTAVPTDISTDAVTTVGTPTFTVSSQPNKITTSSSASSAPSSSKSTPSSSSSLPSSPFSLSSPSSMSSQSTPPSSSLSSSSSSATSISSGIVTISPNTNLQSSMTSTHVFSSTRASSTVKTSEIGLAIALGVMAFLFFGAVAVFYIRLRRRNSQKYETNIAHMNYNGTVDDSFFASRLSRQDLIPPDLNNGGVSPRESVFMEGTPRDSIVFSNQNGHFDARWSACGPAQHNRPLPNPHNRQSSHSESFNMDRDSPADRPSSFFALGASQQSPTTPNSDGRVSDQREPFNKDRWPRNSPADRPSSFFAPDVSQHSPTTPNSDGSSAREGNHRDSFHLHRPARESIYENDSDPDDHVYEKVMLDKFPKSHSQSSV